MTTVELTGFEMMRMKALGQFLDISLKLVVKAVVNAGSIALCAAFDELLDDSSVDVEQVVARHSCIQFYRLKGNFCGQWQTAIPIIDKGKD